MKSDYPNHYERAFENWLIDNHVQYVSGEEHKKKAFSRLQVKSFDFLLYPPNQQIIIAEVKGRSFKGTTLAKLAGLECWVTAGDVEGLARWQEVLGPTHTAVFVFAYKVENVDVDFDGRDFYDYSGRRYIFFGVRLDDYRRFMVRRSPKWRTVTLPAEDFRQCAVQVQQLLS
ncbi:MAG: HYExAFE family protein [Planctomycetota bacterium]|jgi:hypothetical protein